MDIYYKGEDLFLTDKENCNHENTYVDKKGIVRCCYCNSLMEILSMEWVAKDDML